MKTYSVRLLALLLAAAPGIAHAQTAWLLVPRAAQSAVVRAEGQTVRDIVTFRGSAASYGESRSAVVVVGAEGVYVIDKESATVTYFLPATQPGYVGYPVEDLSGPLRNTLVTDSHALFSIYRFPGQAPPNELGGQYDIVRMSLEDGSLKSIPLPEDCLHPQLAELAGVPVLYAWGSDLAFKLDAANGGVVRVQGNDDVADLRTKEARDRRSLRGAPPAFIRYAVVAGAGSFRLSRFGELDHVLDERLATVSGPGGSIWLGPAHEVLALRSGLTDGKPAIGVVRQREAVRLEEGGTLSALDASSLDIVWTSDVARGAIPESFYAANDGSFFYIDRVSGDVVRLSREGTSTGWHLPPGQSRSARILSIEMD